MSAKKIIVGMFIVFIILGCEIKHKTYEKFRNDDESKRIHQITKVLEKASLKSYNKFTLIYIDYMITTVDFYKILERQFPDANFRKFFKKAVLTLYYSYEPDNFKLSSKEWHKKSEVFLLNLLTSSYPYNYGKEKYREYIKEAILKNEYNVFCFYSSDTEDPEEIAKGGNWKFYKWYNATLAWCSNEYTFFDFKKLDLKEQSLVLRRNALFNIFDNEGIIDDDSNKFLDGLQVEWEYRGKYYLTNNSIKELSDDSSFLEVFDTILSIMTE